ncbi:hypothetical protein Agub_g6832 [Astrephomene gubernaculifera]|uniref:Ankyrin repeat domain-containing protein n=1 Tax=Astrephomene gubernaculifera TaxID=47775 RepID=A0AAD3DRS5_9CHLO|nr:hypothetical protein Agub_g6832 [Astrephomene gubernaculifera]
MSVIEQQERSQAWPQLLPELAEHITSFLPPNEVACTVRLVNKAAAVQFRAYTIVRLSSPVPEHAFKQQWCRPGATRGLTLNQRQKLLCLTARSGCIPNLEVIIANVGILLLTVEVMRAAASAGQLKVCQLLWQHGCPFEGALRAAAGAGHQDICEWLLDNGGLDDTHAVYTAARGGHVGLLKWLLQQFREPEEVRRWVDAVELCSAVATGCGLPELQWLMGKWQERLRLHELQERYKSDIVGGAARSSTPDWREKVEWLEEQGFHTTTGVSYCAAACTDALDRLRWLHSKGYKLEAEAALYLARNGNVQALEYLLSEEVRPEDWCSRMAFACGLQAAAGGHLAALQLLHTHGCPMNEYILERAAQGEQLHVLVWLVEELGEAVQLSAKTFSAAAKSCNVALLSWLRERGCPWDGEAFVKAARAGGEEALEWLVEQGCPMPDDGNCYVSVAVNGDLATLRCLRRLGCPWGPPGHVYSGCVDRGCHASVLEWLRQEGCPVEV